MQFMDKLPPNFRNIPYMGIHFNRFKFLLDRPRPHNRFLLLQFWDLKKKGYSKNKVMY